MDWAILPLTNQERVVRDSGATEMSMDKMGPSEKPVSRTVGHAPLLVHTDCFRFVRDRPSNRRGLEDFSVRTVTCDS
jgi:hypothetical protein